MKPLTKQTVKTASKFVTIGLLIGLLIGAFIAYGQSPTSTFTISSGVYPGAPSYTIWTEGSEYFAKDANGRLDYSGTDCSGVLVNCLSALGINGGEIHFRAGVYDFFTPIVLDESSVGWVISGEGTTNYYWSGAAPETPCTLLRKRFNGYFFTITGDLGTSVHTPFRFEDMQLGSLTNIEFNLESVPYTGGCLYVEERGWWELRNVRINKFDGDLIHIHDCARGRMSSVICDETKSGYGVYLDGLGDSYIQDLEVDANVQPASKAALYIGAGVDCHFVGGHIEGWRGIEIYSGVTIENMAIMWSMENSIYIAGQGVKLIGIACLDPNQGSFAGNASAAIFIDTGSDAALTQIIGGSVEGTIVMGAYVTIDCVSVNMINCTDWNTIVNCAYIQTINSLQNNVIMANRFYAPATITNSTGKNYLRGNYRVDTWQWIPDSTP